MAERDPWEIGYQPTRQRLTPEAVQGAVMAASEKTGIPPELIFGHWSHETGKFTNRGATDLNNFAGITLPGGDKVGYKKYDTIDDFVEDYSSLVNRRYKNATTAGTPEEFVQGLKGWFTDDPRNYVAGVRNASAQYSEADPWEQAADTTDTTKQTPVEVKKEKQQGPQGFWEGVGHGAKMLGLGTGQAVLEGGQWIRDKLGLDSNQANVDKLQGIIDAEKGSFANAGGLAEAGKVVGGVAPTLLMPGGAAGGFLKKLLSNAAQGATIGGLQPTSGDESRLANAAEGAAWGGGASAALSAVRPVGRAIKQTLGATTGAGPGAVEEAIRGGKPFTEAMRGKITGEEIVDNAKTALQVIKDNRGSAYQKQLAKISQNQKPIDLNLIGKDIDKLLDRYNVKWSADPKTGEVIFDLSRVPMGAAGRRDIRNVLRTLLDWGKKPGDNTAIGVDTLKRQLADFYSDSSQARGFVATLEKRVADVLRKEVPGYEQMTKGYADATRLIKDIESNLMLRKQGMSGRITADQTLRRLMSSMRENFEMRKDLVQALGNGGGQDLIGQIGGYSMNKLIPRGLVGKLSAGSMATLSYLNPKMWPIIAAASPRAVGEFLMYYGKAHRALAPAGRAVEGVATKIGPKAAAVYTTQPDTGR